MAADDDNGDGTGLFDVCAGKNSQLSFWIYLLCFFLSFGTGSLDQGLSDARIHCHGDGPDLAW